MNIEDKIAKAVHTTRCVILQREADATFNRAAYTVWNPDTLYVGEHEYLHIVDANRVDQYPVKHFMGMRVIRVKLESYLQVACVGGEL